jgi:hypothetical protein
MRRRKRRKKRSGGGGWVYGDVELKGGVQHTAQHTAPHV